MNTPKGIAFLDRMIALRERIESGEEGLDQARVQGASGIISRSVGMHVAALASVRAAGGTPHLARTQEFVMGAASEAGARRCALPKTLFAGYCEDAHDELSRVSVRRGAPGGPRAARLSRAARLDAGLHSPSGRRL